MVFARYVMFSEVYWHHAVRSASTMFARAFFDLHGQFNLQDLFLQSEPQMIESLRHAAKGTDVESLIEGVFGSQRRLYKRVAEYSLYQNEPLYQLLRGKPFGKLVQVASNVATRLTAATGTQVKATDVIIDAPPAHREVEFKVDIYFPKESVYRPLQDVSPVVDSLARTQFDDYVKRVRVFVAPLAGEIPVREQLDEIVQAAANECLGG